MPYTTVVPSTTITAAWGNANVRDQVITPFASAAARTSAITAAVEGMLSYRSDVKAFEGYDGTAWQTLGYLPNVLVAIKTADDLSTTSTTLKNDAHLFFNNLPVNSKWILTSNVFYYADTATDMRVGWSGPAGATLTWNLGGMNGAATDPNGGMYSGTNTIAGTDIAGGAGAPTPTVIMRPSGLLTVAGTAGTLQFRWAQNTSTVNGVNTLKDSWMMLTRVG